MDSHAQGHWTRDCEGIAAVPQNGFGLHLGQSLHLWLWQQGQTQRRHVFAGGFLAGDGAGSRYRRMDVDEVQTGLVQASQEGRNVVPTDGDQIWWAGIGVSVLCQGPGKFVHHRRTSTGFGDDGGRECPVAREFRCQLRHRGVQKAGDGTCQIETPRMVASGVPVLGLSPLESKAQCSAESEMDHVTTLDLFNSVSFIFFALLFASSDWAIYLT